MPQTINEIIELAQLSGIPFQARPQDQYRPTDKTYSGQPSDHSRGWAVDFMGYNQDELAKYFMGIAQAGGALEVTHYSEATGTWYGYNGRKGRPVDPNAAGNKQLVADHHNHLHVAVSPEQVGPGSILDRLRKKLITVADIAKGVLGVATGGIGPALVGTAPKTVTEALGNIGGAMTSIGQSAMSIGRVSDMVTRAFLPTNLLRGVMFFGGIISILIGIFFLAREVRESSP